MNATNRASWLAACSFVLCGLAAPAHSQAVASGAEPRTNDPKSVLQRFAAAMNAGDTNAALTLWAEEAAITNTRGRMIAGKERIRRFLQANITMKQRLDPESVQVAGDKLIWNNQESNDSYRKLGVAPVQIVSEMIVRDGMIRAYVGYLPSTEIARIEQACAAPQGKEVLPNGEPCNEFIEKARAQTAKLTGASKSEKK